MNVLKNHSENAVSVQELGEIARKLGYRYVEVAGVRYRVRVTEAGNTKLDTVD